MKEKILTNVRIIDPSQKMDEIGTIIVNEKGKIQSIGNKVKISDASKSADRIDGAIIGSCFIFYFLSLFM